MTNADLIASGSTQWHDGSRCNCMNLNVELKNYSCSPLAVGTWLLSWWRDQGQRSEPTRLWKRNTLQGCQVGMLQGPHQSGPRSQPRGLLPVLDIWMLPRQHWTSPGTVLVQITSIISAVHKNEGRTSKLFSSSLLASWVLNSSLFVNLASVLATTRTRSVVVKMLKIK